jgi:2'-5' RNA ligase superfamily
MGGDFVQEYYTVAFLDIAADDRRWIQRFREQHDPFYGTVDPHFTLAFGIRDLPENLYLNHIAGVARASRQIPFTCRYAMLGADDVDDTAYVFLVPDEGNAAISRLHDRIYVGPFQPFLKLDLPYIPHISIASMKDCGRAKELCDELNEQEICIQGRLTALTPGVRKDGRFHPFRSYVLAPA